MRCIKEKRTISNDLWRNCVFDVNPPSEALIVAENCFGEHIIAFILLYRAGQSKT